MCHTSRVTCHMSRVTCHMSRVTCHMSLFKASALWADAFYKSKCPSVCPCVRLSVCSLLRYRLTVFLPPLPEVGCPICLEIRNPWGKVMERNGLRYEHLCLKLSKIAAQKKSFFLHFFRFSIFFTCLFAPISQSRMSNIFKDSESLGKSNVKKWSQIWTFLIENCLK